ncbi:hypothetical protein RJD24_02520 [Bacillaceae bacterium IKA-2]|nr:hypothetical protein RJD24_02520 [Bacillaceae bacterium IKA-2]
MNILLKVFFFIALTGFFIGGTAIRISDFQSYINIFIFFNGILIIIISLLVTKSNFKININKFTILIFVCFLGLSISSLINGSSSDFLFSIKFLFLFLFFVIALRNIRDFISFRIISWSFLLSSSFIVVLSILEDPPNFFAIRPYSGLFDNPNSFGLLTGTMFSVVLVLFVSNIFYKLNVKLVLFYFSLMVCILLLISLSASRTSFVTALLLLLIVVIIYCIKFLKRKAFNIGKVLNIFLIILLITSLSFIFINSSYYSVVEESIFNKFTQRSIGGDVTAGRDRIWNSILSESILIGPSEYSSNPNNPSAHNTFISKIGNHGWIVGIFYLIFWLVAFIQSIIYFWKNCRVDKYASFPFVSILTFILLSMTEVLTMNSAELLALCSIAFLSHKNG